MTFWDRWVWPAGGSGGIPGDVVGTLVWVVGAAIVTVIVWPPLRHRLEGWVHRLFAVHHDPLHETLDAVRHRLDHIIENHPDLPPLEDPE